MIEGETIGIDLGTTYSCIGVYQNGKVEIIANEQGNNITPSCVAFNNKVRLVGEAALSQIQNNPNNTIVNVKRLIGQTSRSAYVRSDIEKMKYTIKSDSSHNISIQVQYNSKIYSFTPQEISAMILIHLKKLATTYLGKEVKNAVITVPAYFNENQRQATKEAASIAGLNVIRLINEPTAAALAYGIEQYTQTKNERKQRLFGNKSPKNKKSPKNITGTEATVLVFDMGGGTLDVSIVNIDNGIYSVVGTAGNMHLGGSDLTDRILEHFLKESKIKYRIHNLDDRAYSRLRIACEKAKHTLSSTFKAYIEIDKFIKSIDFKSFITRARFEDLIAVDLKKCMRCIHDVLRDTNLTRMDIDNVVLVGGSSKIPKIRQMIHKFFRKEPCISINPEEAIAYGATIQATILAGITNDLFDTLLVDITPFSLGIEIIGEGFEKIITKNTTIPCRRNKLFTTTSDNQSSVSIKIFQGEHDVSKKNVPLGTFILGNIPPMPKNTSRIDVLFELDANGLLVVTAKELSNPKASQCITVSLTKPTTNSDYQNKTVF